MRLLSAIALLAGAIAVFFVTFVALAMLGIWVTSLLGGNAWWGMVLIYPQFFVAIVVAVLFLRYWTTRTNLNGNAR